MAAAPTHVPPADDGRSPSRPLRQASLLDADSAFGMAVPAGERDHARQVLRFEVQQHTRWEPERLERPGLVGALVVRGFGLGSIDVGNRRTGCLCGPGDLLSPQLLPADSTIAATGRMEVLKPMTLLVLDDRVWRAAARWPRIGGLLCERLHEAVAGQRLLAALTAFSRVEERLLGSMWYFADRWGTVHADGVHVSLPLTHRTLGELVGSRRPTVTLAVGELAQRGLLRRDDDGWVLDRGVLEALQALGDGDGDGLGPSGSIFDQAFDMLSADGAAGGAGGTAPPDQSGRS